eukprot:3077007-Prymnesium_polylepis.1
MNLDGSLAEACELLQAQEAVAVCVKGVERGACSTRTASDLAAPGIQRDRADLMDEVAHLQPAQLPGAVVVEHPKCLSHERGLHRVQQRPHELHLRVHLGCDDALSPSAASVADACPLPRGIFRAALRPTGRDIFLGAWAAACCARVRT